MATAHGRRLGQDHDHGATGEGGTTLSPDEADINGTLTFERLIQSVLTQNQQARNDREIVSTEPRTGSDAIWVSASGGDNSLATEDVNQSNPLSTLDEALQRIPFIVQHPWHIRLEDGTYDSVNDISGPVAVLSGWESTGVVPQFKVQGNATTPTNVTVDVNFWNMMVMNPETDDTGSDAVLNSFEMTGTFNNKGGNFSIADVTFTGANGTAALLGKGGGITQFHNCTFQTGLDYVVNLANPGSQVVLRNCQGSVSKYTYKLQNGAMGVQSGTSEGIGDLGLYELGAGGIMFDYRGSPFDRFIQLADDWNDERLNADRVTTSQMQYRPQWSDESGSVEATDGILRIPAGDSTTQAVQTTPALGPHPNIISNLIFEVKFLSDPTAGNFTLHFCRNQDGFNEWRVRFDADGNMNLQKTNSNTDTTVISGSYTNDQSWHEVEVTRNDSAGWELFEDGSSQGTATDSFTATRDYNLRWESTLDAEVHVDNLKLGT